MQEGDVALVLRDLFIVVLKMSAPGLLAALAVGLLVSVVQAVTQINESTLAFVPKILVVGLVFSVGGSFMYTVLVDFTHGIFDRLIEVGGR